MANVIMQPNNAMQINASDENATNSYDTMSGLINNNEKNLMDGIEEPSCNNITYNPVRNDNSEKNLEDINFNIDAKIPLTEEGSDDKSKDIQPNILDNENNKIESSCDNVLQLNNITETIHNDQNVSENDDKSRQVELQSKKYLRIVDSESEDDDIINFTSRKKVNVIEDDNESAISNESLKTNDVIKNKNDKEIIDSDSDSKSQHSEEIPKFIKKSKQIFQTLVDSESDEDEIHETESPLEEDNKCTNFRESNEKIIKSKNNKKESNKKGSIRDSKVEAMKKIHSETQRLIRESEISLPYHRPKSRTLQEFLTRRQVSGMLPKAPTTASKLKMSSAIVSKILEDKEKEAEEFYKSESESEEETAEIEKNRISKSNINNSNIFYIEKNAPSNGIKYVLNENTEKLMNNDTSNNEEISLKSPEASLNNFSRGLSNEITDAKTESNDKIDQSDVRSFKENVQYNVETLYKTTMDHDGSKNIEIDVQETVDILLRSVEYETEKNNKDELNEDSVRYKITNEIHSEETAHEIPKEQNQNIEKQIHIETKDDHQNIDSSVSEKGSQETEDHIQGLPLPDFIDKEEKSIKKQLLPTIKSNIEPRLRGNPGMIIDLSCDVKPNKAGVESLLNRFFSKHTTTDKDIEKITKINVVHLEETLDGSKLVKHAFLHKQLILEPEDPELAKPGAKLKRLKDDLKFKMAMKRNEEWRQKEQEVKEQEDQLKEDEELYDICNEGNLYDETSESGESEPEENDIPMLDKKNKPACEFVDDEAMESEDEQEKNEKINVDEEEEEEEENEEEEEENEEEEVEEEENEEEEDEEENEEEEDDERNYGKNPVNDIHSNESSNESVAIKKKRKLNRIIKAFEDDSNSLLSNISIDKVNEPKKKAFERTATDIDLFETNSNNCQSDWNSDEECNVSISDKNKQTDTMTQTCKTPSIKTSVLDFVSPITQLTILNTNSDSDKKKSAKKNEFTFASSIDSFSQIHMPFEKTIKSIDTPDRRVSLQKKLFDDFNNVTTDEDLMELCSGAFPSTQMDFNPTTFTSSKQTSLLDALNTQTLDINKLDKDIILENETSQDMKLFLDDNSSSPTASNIKENSKENSSTDAPWSKLFAVVPSDDEEDSRNTNKMNFLRKRHVRKLELSDDEEESADNLQSDEEEAEADEYLDYDSEENEIVVSKKSIKKVTSEFFENEAELSESDWDSADEDEKDLDKLEREEGDEDDIDENKVRNQLERIHMKQIIDQDQREVRMLQEILFEDGDLHTDGSGRQRKFKWKNIDKLGENNDVPSVDDDANVPIDAQENENELAWYKLRHEREKFLEEKRRTDVDVEIEEDLEKSEIFKLGVKLLKKIESGQSDKEDSSQNYDKSIEPIMPRNLSDLLNTASPGGNESTLRTILKKRSFLSRGEHELERIAKRVKLNDTVNLVQMNTKNFVFAHISPVVKNNDDEENENTQGEKENESKDKASQRRKRKAMTSMTPTTTKRVKQEGTGTKKKKLF